MADSQVRGQTTVVEEQQQQRNKIVTKNERISKMRVVKRSLQVPSVPSCLRPQTINRLPNKLQGYGFQACKLFCGRAVRTEHLR